MSLSQLLEPAFWLIMNVNHVVCLSVPQIHWPASAERKAECRMTGKGGQVGPFFTPLIFMSFTVRFDMPHQR